MLTVDYKLGRKEFRVHGVRSVEQGDKYLYLYMDDKSGSPESLYMVPRGKMLRVHASTFQFNMTRPEVLCTLH